MRLSNAYEDIMTKRQTYFVRENQTVFLDSTVDEVAIVSGEYIFWFVC